MKRIKQMPLLTRSLTVMFWVVARMENDELLYEGGDANGYGIWTNNYRRAFFHDTPPHPDELRRIRVFGRPSLPEETPLLILEVERVIAETAYLVEPDEFTFMGEGI